MNVTTDAVEPPYITTSSQPRGSHDYLFVVGFFCTVVLLLTITYASYSCKCTRPSPPPPTISFGTTTYDDGSNNHLVRFSLGFDDDDLATLPKFAYSEVTILTHRTDTITATATSCSICLVDYKSEELVRLLPECGHLFHVSCIDTWLKAHPTCPVCRNSPLAGVNQFNKDHDSFV